MESCFRLADVVKLHDPQGTHHDLSCKVIPTIAIQFFFVWIVHLMAVHTTVTPPLGS